MFLLGRHAMFGQDPPIYFRSMTAVRLPSLAIVQPINLPAVPLPSTTTSYCSAVFIRFISYDGLSTPNFMYSSGPTNGRQDPAASELCICPLSLISVNLRNGPEPSRARGL